MTTAVAMNEEEARARLRLIEIEEEELSLEPEVQTEDQAPDPTSPAIPKPPAPPRENLNRDRALQLATALPKAYLGFMDAPHMASKGFAGGMDWLAEKGILKDKPPFPLDFMYARAKTNQTLSDIPEVKPYSDAIRKDYITGEESPAIDALSTGIEWGAELPFAVATKAAKVPALVMGGSAAIGDYLQNKGYLGDTEGVAGELGGGLFGIIAALRYGKTQGLDDAQEKAVEFIRLNTKNPDDVARALDDYVDNIQAGGQKEVGTLADITRDPGIYNAETGAAKEANFAGRLRDITQGRKEQIIDDVKAPFGLEDIGHRAKVAAENLIEGIKGTGTRRTVALRRAAERKSAKAAEEARVPVAESQAKLERAIAAQESATLNAQTAQQAATESRLPLANAQRPSQASKATKEAVDKAKAPYDLAEKKAWTAFKEQPKVDIAPVKAVVDDAVSQAPDYVGKDLRKVYGGLLDDMFGNAEKEIAGMGDNVSGVGIHTWKRNVETTMNARAGEFGVSESKWNEADEIMKSILKEVDGVLVRTNPYWKQAKAATTAKYDMFGDLATKAEPELYVKKLGGFAGERGVVLSRQLDKIGLENAQKIKVDNLKAFAAEGKVDQAFMTRYADVFDGLPPEVRNTFQRMVDTTAAEKATAKLADDAGRLTGKTETAALKTEVAAEREATRLERALRLKNDRIAADTQRLTDSVTNSWVGKYANNSDTTLAALLKREKGKDLGKVYRALEKRGEGPAFKAAVRDKIERMMLQGADAKPDVLPSVGRKWDNIEETLHDSGILDWKEIADIRGSLERTYSTTLRSQSWAEIAHKMDSLSKMLGEKFTSALALRVLPGSSLIMASATGRISRYIMNKMGSGTGKTAAQRAMEELLLDPEKYFVAAKGAKTAEQAVLNVMRKVFGASLVERALEEDEDGTE